MFGSGLNEKNIIIGFHYGTRLKFSALGSDLLPNLAFFSLDPAKWVSLYRYDKDGNRHDNITDWAVEQFVAAYLDEGAVATAKVSLHSLEAKRAKLDGLMGKPAAATVPAPALPNGQWYLTKQDIFHYVYAVLHHQAYREKYALNLKREFPRIPFYADFRQWAAWGEALMQLHIDYETVQPYPLVRKEQTTPDDHNTDQNKILAKAKLKADKLAGTIILDGYTRLEGIPAKAWTYMLGNRSALEWVLDQHKEKTPKDPTIREKFDTYRFADYKEHVIDLLARVCMVSLETQAIIARMPATVEDALLQQAG